MVNKLLKRFRRLLAVLMILFGFFLVINIVGYIAVTNLAELLDPGVWMLFIASFIIVYLGLRLYTEDYGDGNSAPT